MNGQFFVFLFKTDISKTSCFTFGGNKKLELDRRSFRDKAISSFVHNDKHETRRIVRLLSIKRADKHETAFTW